jgi:hypothetical protein
MSLTDDERSRTLIGPRRATHSWRRPPPPPVASHASSAQATVLVDARAGALDRRSASSVASASCSPAPAQPRAAQGRQRSRATRSLDPSGDARSFFVAGPCNDVPPHVTTYCGGAR